jgi:hypothetical protein
VPNLTDSNPYWIDLRRFARRTYRASRDLFQQTGRRQPSEMRKELEPRSEWQTQRPVFIKGLLDWLSASNDPEMVAQLSTRLDAMLEFTIFVTREFLLRNCPPESTRPTYSPNFNSNIWPLRDSSS